MSEETINGMSKEQWEKPDWAKKLFAPHSNEAAKEFEQQFIKIFMRASGRTTRIVDQCIQDFFEKGECTVQDHTDSSHSDRRVMDIVIHRLETEHGIKTARKQGNKLLRL